MRGRIKNIWGEGKNPSFIWLKKGKLVCNFDGVLRALKTPGNADP
jgi:hypothetical protein